MWLFVHLAFLNGFASRFGALFRWARSMLGRARAERVISVAPHAAATSARPALDPYEAIVLDEHETSDTSKWDGMTDD